MVKPRCRVLLAFPRCAVVLLRCAKFALAHEACHPTREGCAPPGQKTTFCCFSPAGLRRKPDFSAETHFEINLYIQLLLFTNPHSE